MGNLPLSFEANQGQSDPGVKFLSRGAGYSLFVTVNEAVLALQTPAASRDGTKRAKEILEPPARTVLRMKLLDDLPGRQWRRLGYRYRVGCHRQRLHRGLDILDRLPHGQSDSADVARTQQRLRYQAHP